MFDADIFFYVYYHDSPDDAWKVVYFMFVPQGLKSEGLYRISGFSDSVEEVKMAFDKGECPSSLSCFIDFCLPMIQWLTSSAFMCLLMAHWTFQINEKLMDLWRITVHLGEEILVWHAPHTQSFTVQTSWRGGPQGIQTMEVLSLLQHGCKKKKKKPPLLWLSENELVLVQCGVNFN